jgi:hypothetical protein
MKHFQSEGTVKLRCQQVARASLAGTKSGTICELSGATRTDRTLTREITMTDTMAFAQSPEMLHVTDQNNIERWKADRLTLAQPKEMHTQQARKTLVCHFKTKIGRADM